jgi:hypothetical protein
MWSTICVASLAEDFDLNNLIIFLGEGQSFREDGVFDRTWA